MCVFLCYPYGKSRRVLHVETQLAIRNTHKEYIGEYVLKRLFNQNLHQAKQKKNYSGFKLAFRSFLGAVILKKSHNYIEIIMWFEAGLFILREC